MENLKAPKYLIASLSPNGDELVIIRTRTPFFIALYEMGNMVKNRFYIYPKLTRPLNNSRLASLLSVTASELEEPSYDLDSIELVEGSFTPPRWLVADSPLSRQDLAHVAWVVDTHKQNIFSIIENDDGSKDVEACQKKRAFDTTEEANEAMKELWQDAREAAEILRLWEEAEDE